MAKPLTATDHDAPEPVPAIPHHREGEPVPPASPPENRPMLTFPTRGHQCHQYWMVCGFYECAHGHVLRINPRVQPPTT
ncbi:hypothetical protein [Kibdelosporangium phytohabitans]|uniref:Uncharacterized protein n=1 Tax=Kibdelosporangium phytohabitans TaxID=860235 RepID=A0A0N9I4L6_9PSEU|nr:hypothetical protein [Kibdelosporangium phytohabitans]ALG09779.1 hypothetical protein AOZ06_25335 [Kibdelosporangium phytohabitans]MBE1468845.1 hypothetical protein [Kibdelosporangium phytohabitans]